MLTQPLIDPSRPTRSRPVFLSGIGQALGFRTLGNPELSRLTGLKESAILHLTGIRTRSFSPFEDETDLAVRAAEDLFCRMGERKAPDLLLVATTTPTSQIPSTAMKIHGRLFPEESGPALPAMDIGGSCAAFLTGLFVARAQIEAGAAENVLLINTEQKTRHICPQHAPETALLFGDAATAVWISGSRNVFPSGRTPRAPLLVRAVRIGADGSHARLITYETDPVTGRKILRMEGPALFRRAIRTLARESEALLAAHALSSDMVEAFIFHQANGRILEGIARALGVVHDRIPRTVDHHGNTSSASLGITLNHFLSGKRPDRPEGPLLLGAIGGGLTWGVALLTPNA